VSAGRVSIEPREALSPGQISLDAVKKLLPCAGEQRPPEEEDYTHPTAGRRGSSEEWISKFRKYVVSVSRI
jgi:hypothetical protein